MSMDAAQPYSAAMPVYVSLLRAVNVGGRKVPMAALRDLLERLGHDDVVTYLQSGNVVSRAGARSSGVVERAVSAAVTAEFGFDVDVLVRTPHQLRVVLDGNPFLPARGSRPDPKSLHVTFLARAPKATLVREIDGSAFAPDEFRVVGREVFLTCPGGYGRTKITNSWFERKLGVPATTRNWSTVTELADLSGA
jgi:uncharacterized protein (DUF1697 family)